MAAGWLSILQWTEHARWAQSTAPATTTPQTQRLLTVAPTAVPAQVGASEQLVADSTHHPLMMAMAVGMPANGHNPAVDDRLGQKDSKHHAG